MTKKIDEETMLENIENLRSELSETKDSCRHTCSIQIPTPAPLKTKD